ncbi:MAG: hypothetical protein V2B14_01460, partial [bacterium]
MLQSNGNCWHNYGIPKYLKGTPLTGYDDAPGLILNNGVLLRFNARNTSCTGLYDGTVVGCGYINIDVNGFKGPNTLGKDIYFIWILENSIKPREVQDCTTSSYGNGCAAKVLKG